jgi:NAD-dependent DNA ligase
MSCWLYYEKDDPKLSDEEFDWVSRELISQWDKVTHTHKDLLKKDLIGTGFFIKYHTISS